MASAGPTVSAFNDGWHLNPQAVKVLVATLYEEGIVEKTLTNMGMSYCEAHIMFQGANKAAAKADPILDAAKEVAKNRRIGTTT